MAIGVAVSQPFLGVSSLNFGPLATVAFFLARLWRVVRNRGPGQRKVDPTFRPDDALL